MVQNRVKHHKYGQIYRSISKYQEAGDTLSQVRMTIGPLANFK